MAKRCKHLNVEIDEEIIGTQYIEIKDGQKVFDGDAGANFDPTGRYFVECKDCGLKKTYTLSNRPRWLGDYIYQSPVRTYTWALEPNPSPVSHSQSNEVAE